MVSVGKIVYKNGKQWLIPTALAGGATFLKNRYGSSNIPRNIFNVKKDYRTGKRVVSAMLGGTNKEPNSRFKRQKLTRGPRRNLRRVLQPMRNNKVGMRMTAHSKGIPNRKFLKSGALEVQENGGTVTGDGNGTVYLGHASAPGTLMLNIIMKAMYRSLFRKAGQDFKDWGEDPIGTSVTAPTRLTINWRARVDTVGQSTFIYDIVPTNSHRTNAEAWASGFAAAVRAVPSEVFELLEVRMAIDDTAGSGGAEQVSILRPQQTQVHLTTRSRLAVQNRTVGAGAGSSSATNIENNPLVGKIYGKSGLANGFKQKGPNASGEDLVADRFNGLIKFDSSNSPDLQKPPNGWHFGATKTTKVVMDPGAIRSSVVSWSSEMNLNKALNLVIPDTTHQYIKMGHVEMIGMEKMLDATRTATPRIDIGYEVTQTFGAYLGPSKGIIQRPFLNVGTTPIP